MNVKFDPELVKRYRLIGFDNKIGALTDSNSVMEGGETGSGQSMIAAFEIQTDFKESDDVNLKKFGEINLQYKLPRDTVKQEVNEIIPYELVSFSELEPRYRFATSVIMFGLILKASPFAKEISWGDVLYHASEAANPTDINQSQFVELVYKAKALYTKLKKKKKN
jgi:Ca-activated chloride channel family protein